ncbi:hypothetical protein ACFXHK_27070 [Embleya sp. NPDC059267]|uniref:hypothetical protein n=1 Tax=unclassified Embleya TaxID=2699296 RepID=UPI003409FE9B
MGNTKAAGFVRALPDGPAAFAAMSSGRRSSAGNLRDDVLDDVLDDLIDPLLDYLTAPAITPWTK